MNLKLPAAGSDSLSGRLPVDLEALMLETAADKMLDDTGPVYLVRCTGTKDGVPCRAILGLSASEKTECPECGTLHGPWRNHLSLRTRTKNA